MKVLVVILVALSLAGCNTPQFITKEKLTVIAPDRTFYNCPSVGRYPNPDTLTDVEVAKLLLNYERSNAECRRSMNAIKTFIENAKSRAEESE